MPDRPPADHLRRIETRLNAIVVLLAAGIALALFVAVRQTMYWIPYLLLIGLIAMIVAVGALGLGAWLTPSGTATPESASESAAGPSSEGER